MSGMYSAGPPPYDRIEQIGLESEPPYARIEQSGRWTYDVAVVDGLMEESPGSVVLGRRWAQSKGRRLLRRYLARKARRANVQKLYESETR